tara:strand:+ start:2423 stop:3112 length:690 start_codon:yes stop_codon:yes gene_type:complete
MQKYSRTIKVFLQRMFAGDKPSILVASMGRSGSTLLHSAVVTGWARKRFGVFAGGAQRFVADEAWRLDEVNLIGGVVYKTHDLAQFVPKSANIKALFVFDQPSKVAKSVASCRAKFGCNWFEEHREHLRGDGTFQEFLERDTLRFEEQVLSWSTQDHVSVLGVRYSSIWENKDAIEAFLGFSIRLPQKVPRTAPQVSADVLERIKQSYSALDRRIDIVPDLFGDGKVDR